MSGHILRMRKEARALFWPWFAVMSAGLFGLMSYSVGFNEDFIELTSRLGFWIGIPLLATLSFGNEFQHGTLVLLFSQPAERSRLWMEKSGVLAVAVVSAGFVHWLAWRTDFQQATTEVMIAAIVWPIITVCS